VVIAAIFFLLFRRRRLSNPVDGVGEANPAYWTTSNAEPVAHPNGMYPAPEQIQRNQVLESPPPMISSVGYTSVAPPAVSETRTNADVASAISFGSQPKLATRSIPSHTLPPTQSGANTSDIASRLTDEQADLVTNLHRHNVPASAIAHVMERMLEGGGSRMVGDQLDEAVVEAHAPPSYNSHSA
jgi:hypothetical protein